MNRYAVVCAVFIVSFAAVILSACDVGGGEEETPTPRRTPEERPTSTPTPTPLPTDTPTPTPTPTPASFIESLEYPQPRYFPEWAYRARIGGVYFEPGDADEAGIRARLSGLSAQHVSVVLANCPLGSYYGAWVEDDYFARNVALVGDVVRIAHELDMKVVLYLTGLEMIDEGGHDIEAEHPDWLQVSIDGEPMVFTGIGSEEVHWLEEGQTDAWFNPRSGYLDMYLGRLPGIVGTGVDGLWIDTGYLPNGVGNTDDLWPSHDELSAEAFREAYGYDLPDEQDWSDEAWQRWVTWRHEEIALFLQRVQQKGAESNPGLVFFNENWATDTAGATIYANDPTAYTAMPEISTGHEVDVSGGIRMDLDDTGMKDASVEDWLYFAAMIKFARGADYGKPSWILTYGYEPADSERLHGVIVANGANHYETRGPSMDDSVGADYRARVFGWTRENEEAIYGTRSLAQVGLLYSSRSHELVDEGSGWAYDIGDSGFFADYRTAARELMRAHVGFDVIPDNALSAFPLEQYRWLILPYTACIDDGQAEILRRYAENGGRLVLTGEAADYDEWLNPRDENALEGAVAEYFSRGLAGQEKATRKLIEMLASPDSGLPQLQTDAPPSLLLELRGSEGVLSLVAVNLEGSPVEGVRVGFVLPEGYGVSSARWLSPDGGDADVEYEIEGGILNLTIPRVEIMGLVRVQLAKQPN